MAPTPGAPEKPVVRWMFDRIAPRYDLLNHLLSAGVDRRWRRQALELLALSPPARVLDVCAGTADLLIEALRPPAPHRGVGIDFSLEMLRRGARKLRGRAPLVCGDAERLPFASGSFDAAMVAFGIRNVPDPEAAAREMHRVLRPGGRLVVLEFSMPRGIFGEVYRLYFTRLLPLIGGFVSGDRGAYAYLPASVAHFPEGEAFATLLRKAGFTEVVAKPLTGGIAHLYRGDK